MGKKGLQTKKRIVDTTTDLIMKKPLNRISVREICEASGIAKGTFYVHFEAKEEVALAIIEENMADILEDFKKMASIEPSMEIMDAFIDFIFDFTLDNVTFLKIIHDPDFIVFLSEKNMFGNFQLIQQSVEQFVRSGCNKGLFNVGNIEFTAYFLHISIHEIIDRVIYDNSPYNLETLKSESKEIVRKLLV